MGTNRLIYFRTDGNSQIASGHLVRCFSVALSCLQLGMKVCFLISDEDSNDLLTGILGSHSASSLLNDFENNFSIIRLKTAAFDHPDQELPEVLSLLTSNTASAVYFLDSYYVTESYLKALRPLIKIAYLDDLKLFDYPVDLLINYDIIPDTAMPAYRAAYQNAGKLFLGAAYTPLRIQFQDKKACIREQVSHLFITTGASDPYHFCLKFTDKIINSVFHCASDSSLIKKPALIGPGTNQSLSLHIVIGKFNTDKGILYQLAKELPYLILHENVSDMASLMQTCDLAISAAGTTLYELCALGIPTISFTIADNQLSSAQAFQEIGLIPYAGDMRSNPEVVLQSAIDFVTSMSYESKGKPANLAPSLSPSYTKRASIHTRMCHLIDGKGAHRIALALESL